MRTVLDTSVVLGPPPTTLANDDLAISAITLAELQFGVLVARDRDERAERLRRLATVERNFAALPVDATVSAHYGRLAAAMVRHGRQPRTRALDLLIAATAVAHDARLCTRNAVDLRGLEKLVTVVSAD